MRVVNTHKFSSLAILCLILIAAISTGRAEEVTDLTPWKAIEGSSPAMGDYRYRIYNDPGTSHTELQIYRNGTLLRYSARSLGPLYPFTEVTMDPGSGSIYTRIPNGTGFDIKEGYLVRINSSNEIQTFLLNEKKGITINENRTSGGTRIVGEKGKVRLTLSSPDNFGKYCRKLLGLQFYRDDGSQVTIPDSMLNFDIEYSRSKPGAVISISNFENVTILKSTMCKVDAQIYVYWLIFPDGHIERATINTGELVVNYVNYGN